MKWKWVGVGIHDSFQPMGVWRRRRSSGVIEFYIMPYYKLFPSSRRTLFQIDHDAQAIIDSYDFRYTI